jgi:hypothetical protein
VYACQGLQEKAIGVDVTLPSRFGIASPSVQFPVRQGSLLPRGFVLDSQCRCGTTPTARPLQTFSITLTAQLLRAGE